MIRLQIFAGGKATASVFTRLAWLELAYHKVDAYSDYKACLFQNGKGCGPTVFIKNYPRWSSSFWDLLARAIVISLNSTTGGDGEELEFMPPVTVSPKRLAFVDEVWVSVEHVSGGKVTKIRAICEMSVKRDKRKGSYVASLTDNMGNSFEGVRFKYHTDVLIPALLVAKACCAHLTGNTYDLPARPLLWIPKPIPDGTRKIVCVNAVKEPAKSGFNRWLMESRVSTENHPDYGEVVESDYYAQFLIESL